MKKKKVSTMLHGEYTARGLRLVERYGRAVVEYRTGPWCKTQAEAEKRSVWVEAEKQEKALLDYLRTFPLEKK